jgi:hypothetical protein
VVRNREAGITGVKHDSWRDIVGPCEKEGNEVELRTKTELALGVEEGVGRARRPTLDPAW